MRKKIILSFIFCSIFFAVSNSSGEPSPITVIINKDTTSCKENLSGKFKILDIGINQFVHKTGTDKLKTGFWIQYEVLDTENIYLTNDRPNAYIAIGERRYARLYPNEKVYLDKLGIQKAVSEETLVKDGESKPIVLEKGVYLITYNGYFWICNMEGKIIGYTKSQSEEKKYEYIYQDKELIKNLTFVICNLENYQIYFKGAPEINDLVPGGEIRVGLALRDGDGNEYRVPARGPMKVRVYDKEMKEKTIYLEPEYAISNSYNAPLSNGRFSGRLPDNITPKRLVFEYNVSFVDTKGENRTIPVSKTIE